MNLTPAPDYPLLREDVCSNSNHTVNGDIAERLKNEKVIASYTAWNFYGTVWYDAGQFHCQIQVYGVHVQTMSNEDISVLMVEVSEQYGWD